MLSIDTNILLYAYNQDCDQHRAATAFLMECSRRSDVAICELVLVKLYQLLRNPAVLQRPLDAPGSARSSGATRVGRSSKALPLWTRCGHEVRAVAHPLR